MTSPQERAPDPPPPPDDHDRHFRTDHLTQNIARRSARGGVVTVAAQVAGQIEKTHVDVGDRVTAGQELALIDTTSYEALARQSAANLTKATASAIAGTISLFSFIFLLLCLGMHLR